MNKTCSKTITTPDIGEEEDVDISDALQRKIVIYNDDVNSFAHVIQTLCDVLQHTFHQAEQCAFIIHHKGKCNVKEGSFDELKPKAEAICERGINAKIE